MRTSNGGALTFRSTRSVRDRHPWPLGSLGCRCATENSAGGGRAGGGGYLLLACSETRRHAVARACEQLGGTPAPFQFEATGLRTWRADGGAR